MYINFVKSAKCILPGLLLTLSSHSTASTLDAAKIKDKMDAFLQQVNQTMDIDYATSVAMVEGKKVIYLGNVGFSNIEKRIPATAQTRYYIASVTKPFMALAQTIELEKTKFTLNSSLNTLFPDVKFDKNIPGSKINLQALLNHTSGLDDDIIQLGSFLTGIKHAPNEMLAQLKVNQHAPSGQFEYSNLGYNLLSLFDQQQLDKSWQQLIEQNVIQPLGLSNTTTRVDDLRRQHPDQFALPYLYFSKTPKQPVNIVKQDQTLHAAGGMYSTSSDMATFVINELNLGVVNNQQRLSPSIIALTQQPSVVIEPALHKGDFNREFYTLGWYEGKYKQQTLLHHFGSFDGYRPHVSFMPDKKLGLVILNNENMLNDKLTDIIADYAYSIMLNEEDPLPRITARLQKLAAMATKIRQKILEKEQSYADLPSSLTLNNDAYTGQYYHPLAGSVKVSLADDGQLSVDWGLAHSTSTPYKQADSIRIKFRPSQAQVLQFNLKNNQVENLELEGLIFKKQ
ncbi:serine hydrolase domain-containing protein [Neptunicella marina]|uniref:Serine hydrolase n=1 Tax=Neptunicella marina TaxID=2125989 RepID=A0A8J6J0Z6_9ALTE|nr:serine hydrolase [Neptunicella marina]MBC3767741.1 serine hydrolase [Neptunicella marina]